jgi:hypothetical protein
MKAIRRILKKENSTKVLGTGIRTKLVKNQIEVLTYKEFLEMEEQNRIKAINTFGIVVVSCILICIGSLLFAAVKGYITLYI